MKAMMLYTASGPLVILTSYDSPTTPDLLGKLKAKGIAKFIAWDVPLQLAKERYGGHFSVVEHDLRENDDLRVLDYNGERAFGLFSFSELGPSVTYEESKASES